ncbi:competence protein CoiA family protein [Thermoflavimicrobium daqui]|uniref:competence protein CoiA family protein n=1 Tax=Thermoflavimicrobium daqui TaxID=2137476 RepID=UPI00143D5E43|nr:competence protein CoiA family protein [Thermoflavimicrobium daqui]
MKIRAYHRNKYGTIPYALNINKRITLPEQAQPYQKYICPQCKHRLVIRKSKLGKVYFAHYQKGNCTISRSSKMLAKHVLRLKLEEWLKGKSPPIEIKSFLGARYFLPREEIKEIIVDFQPEIHSPTSHIALIDKNNFLFLGIEFRDKERKRPIKKFSWIELDPEETLKNPYLLSSLSTKSSLPYFINHVQLDLFDQE